MAPLVEKRIPHGSLTIDPASRRRALRTVPATLALLLLAFGTILPGRAALRDDEIDRGALKHDPDGPDQILWSTAESPKLRFLFLRLRLRQDDVEEAGARLYLISAQGQEGFRDHELEPWATADSFEYRALTVPFSDDPLAPPNRTHWRGYRLYADDEGDIDWFGADSVATREERVRRFTTLFRRGAELNGAQPGLSDRVLVIPGWAQDAVVFRTRIEWGADTTDVALTTRLTALRRQLKGLDSLGINTLLVGAAPGGGFPLERCWPPESSGEAAADILRRTRMPCGHLMALCEAAHRRGMKVMLELTVAGDAAGEDPISPAATDSLLGLVRQGIGCGVDGYFLHPVDGRGHRVPEHDPIWTALHETAMALLPEAYLVIGDFESGGPADLSAWLVGDRVDAVADGWYDGCVSRFVDAADGGAEELREQLDRRRLATPGPLERIAWRGPTRDARGGVSPASADAGSRRLPALFDLTMYGVTELRSNLSPGNSAGAPGADISAWPRLAQLIALRRDHTALRRGSFNITYAQGGQFAFYRRSSEEILLVAMNRDAEPATIKIALPPGVGFVSARNVPDLLTGAQYPVRGGEITLKDLPARDGVVIQLR